MRRGEALRRITVIYSSESVEGRFRSALDTKMHRYSSKATKGSGSSKEKSLSLVL